MTDPQLAIEPSKTRRSAASAPPTAKPARETPPVPAPAEAVASEAQSRVMLHMPVDVRSIALAVVATILCLYALQWSRDVVAPLLSGVIVSYALSPIVTRLQKLRVPRPVGATVVLCAILGALTWGASSLGGQVDALIDTVPEVTQRVREISNRVAGKESTIERVRMAADDLTAAAGAAASTVISPAPEPTPQPTARRVPRSAPIINPPQAAPDHGFDLRGYLVSGTLGAVSFLGKLSIVFLMALFILASGSSFRRKMVKLAGKSFTQKKVTVETLDDITEQIRRYLLVQVGVSVVVGVCTWLAFLVMGLNNAGAWGLAAGLTNLVPYLGAVVLAAGAAIVALVQFGTPEMAFAVSAVAMVIHAVAGNVLTPWWTGRASKMSPVAVFVAVILFGWLWGVWGLLLGVPVLLIVKSVCDHVDDLRPVGELLGP